MTTVVTLIPQPTHKKFNYTLLANQMMTIREICKLVGLEDYWVLPENNIYGSMDFVIYGDMGDIDIYLVYPRPERKLRKTF